MLIRKKKVCFFVVALFLVFGLTVITAGIIAWNMEPVEASYEDINVDRIGGENRYETSALVAEDKYLTEDNNQENNANGVDAVVIARGDNAGNFADGLAGSVLAGVLDAPVLLTRPDNLPDPIEDVITELGAAKAYVLGGEAAIDEEVTDALEGLDLEVERIFGDSRFETAVEIAEKSKEYGELQNYAFIVNGTATPDALVAGASAYRDGVPILQVGDDMPSATAKAISELGIIEVYLIGGTAVISEDLENKFDELTNVAGRFEGENRYETSVIFAENVFASEAGLVLSGGPDARLADSIGACVYELPILYVQSIPERAEAYMQDVLTRRSLIKIMGGVAAVSENVENEAKEMIRNAILLVPELMVDLGFSTSIVGFDWPANSKINVNIENEYVNNYEVYSHSNRTFHIDFYEKDDQIRPGENINVYGGGYEAKYTVKNIEVTEVNKEENIVTGTADPGAEVEVIIYSEEEVNFDEWPRRELIADENGEWEADFSEAEGDEPWQVAYDIQVETFGFAQIVDDEEFKVTRFSWTGYEEPPTNFSVNLRESFMMGVNWLIGGDVKVEVNGIELDTVNVDDIGMFFVEFEEGDIEPGDVITADDGETQKSHVVTSLQIMEAEILNENEVKANGIADEGTIEVILETPAEEFGPPIEIKSVMVDVGADEEWSVNIITEEDLHEIEDLDIAALQEDDDGDVTIDRIPVE